jgi:hypothetical protein
MSVVLSTRAPYLAGGASAPCPRLRVYQSTGGDCSVTNARHGRPDGPRRWRKRIVR